MATAGDRVRESRMATVVARGVHAMSSRQYPIGLSSPYFLNVLPGGKSLSGHSQRGAETVVYERDPSRRAATARKRS